VRWSGFDTALRASVTPGGRQVRRRFFVNLVLQSQHHPAAPEAPAPVLRLQMQVSITGPTKSRCLL